MPTRPIPLTPRQAQSLLPDRPRRRVSAAGQRSASRGGLNFQARALSDAYRAGLSIFEIPNGCKWVAGGGRPRAVAVKTPFDIGGCIPWQKGRGIFFDCKRVGEDDGLTGFSLLRAEPHQMTNLERLGHGGAIAGLLIEALSIGEIRWLDWRFFRQQGNIVRWDDYPRWHVLGAAGQPVDFHALAEMLDGIGINS